MSLNLGGVETYVLELARGLKKRGVEVYVASAGGGYAAELEAYGIKHYTAPLDSKRPGNLLAAYKMLKRIIREHNIQIVHAHARLPAFICGPLCKRMKVRFVTTAHLTFKASFPYNLLSNWGQAALAVSEDIKTYLVENYGCEPERIIVTVNGMDTDTFSPEVDGTGIIEALGVAPDTGRLRVVNISRLDESRSLAAKKLCEAAPEIERLRKGQADIIIVGDGDDMEAVRNAAEKANKTIGREMVILAGKRLDTNRFLGQGATDIFVGVSRAALEAMSAAKPIVLAGNEGYLGIFTEENAEKAVYSNFCCRGGYPQTDAQTLAQDVITLMDMDTAERKTLGDYGREFVMSRYSVDRMADDTIKLYDLVSRPLKKYDAVLSGYYGSHNSGDDAILGVIINALREVTPGARIAVLSERPRETAQLYNVKSVQKFNLLSIYRLLGQTNMLVSGGGTLVTDITSTRSLLYYLTVMEMAKRRGCKVMLYNSGVGPLRSQKNRERAAKTLKRTDLITLRDEQSLETLNALKVTGVKTIVTADPVFGLKNKEQRYPEHLLETIGINERPYFCISVRSWKSLPQDFEDEMARFVDFMAETYKLIAVFILMQPSQDLEITRRVITKAKAGGCVSDSLLSMDNIQDIISQAKFVVSMRLHTIIYAAKMGVPVIALSYDPKVTVMMETFRQKYHVTVEDISLETLTAFTGEIMSSREAVSAELLSVSKTLEEKALLAAHLAGDIINRRDI